MLHVICIVELHVLTILCVCWVSVLLVYTVHVATVLWTVMAESALDSSSGVVRMWVWIPAWPVAVLVSLSKTLNHNCFVLWMERKAVDPVCCLMHVKEPRILIVKEKGLAPVFLDSCIEHPAGWICAPYKSSVLLLLFIIIFVTGSTWQYS